MDIEQVEDDARRAEREERCELYVHAEYATSNVESAKKRKMRNIEEEDTSTSDLQPFHCWLNRLDIRLRLLCIRVI